MVLRVALGDAAQPFAIDPTELRHESRVLEGAEHDAGIRVHEPAEGREPRRLGMPHAAAEGHLPRLEVEVAARAAVLARAASALGRARAGPRETRGVGDL